MSIVLSSSDATLLYNTQTLFFLLLHRRHYRHPCFVLRGGWGTPSCMYHTGTLHCRQTLHKLTYRNGDMAAISTIKEQQETRPNVTTIKTRQTRRKRRKYLSYLYDTAYRVHKLCYTHTSRYHTVEEFRTVQQNKTFSSHTRTRTRTRSRSRAKYKGPPI